MAENILRVAMWSGPRNISTALMRAWENRRDTTVIDEPFYAFYLRTTGREHPDAAEVIAGGETDWQNVAHLPNEWTSADTDRLSKAYDTSSAVRDRSQLAKRASELLSDS